MENVPFIETPNVYSDTYRDNSKHSVDNSSSYGGVDGLSNTSCVKYTCGVVKHLKGEKDEELLLWATIYFNE